MSLKDKVDKTAKQGVEGGRNRGVVLDSPVIQTDRTASRAGAIIFSTAIFAILFAVVQAVFIYFFLNIDFMSIVVGLVAGWLGVSTIHIAEQWERIVVLRFGKFNRVSGPGLVFTWPIIEHCSLTVDMRIRSIPFGAKETLTADLVPLDVDAVLYWMVWDAEKAALEVSNTAWRCSLQRRQPCVMPLVALLWQASLFGAISWIKS